MAISINGNGTITGISVGGLPDGIVDNGTLANNSVNSNQIVSAENVEDIFAKSSGEFSRRSPRSRVSADDIEIRGYR